MAGIRGCLSGLAAYGAEAAAGLAAGRAAATALAARLRGGGGDERRGGGGAGRDSEDGRGELGVVETPVSGEVQKLLSEKRALHVKGLGGGLGEPPEVGRDAEDGRDEPGAVENPEGAQELLSGLVGDLRESPEGLGDVQRQRVDELGSRDWLRELERTASGREISLAIKGGMLRVDEIAPLETAATLYPSPGSGFTRGRPSAHGEQFPLGFLLGLRIFKASMDNTYVGLYFEDEVDWCSFQDEVDESYEQVLKPAGMEVIIVPKGELHEALSCAFKVSDFPSLVVLDDELFVTMTMEDMDLEELEKVFGPADSEED